jgi:hypothetical protein
MATRSVQLRDRDPGLLVEPEAGSDGASRISLRGCLDEGIGRSLLAAVDAVASGGGTHIRVDLREITGYTSDGVTVASDCCRLASGLPCGVSFLVSAGASRTALLEIFARS